jgi:hypothetical protein
MARTEPEGDVVLERGWTRRRALRNAASYLISLRWGARHLGWRTVKAFSDPAWASAAWSIGGRFPAVSAIQTRQTLPLRPVDGDRTYSDRAIGRRFGSHAAARAVGRQIVRVPARVA